MERKLSCIVIDDDEMSLKIVETLINKTSFLELKGLYSSSLEGASVLSQEQVDIIFLDIEMPEMTGLDLLKTFDTHPQIILISSKESYAVEAFEYEVTDYLLKPIDDYARFLKAVLKAQKGIQKKSKQLIETENPNNVFIKVDSLLVNFNLKDILWVEAYGDYVKLHTPEKYYVVYSTMKAMYDKLPAKDFIRVHRSYIVRLDQIKNIDLTNLQVNKKIIPISNSYKARLMERVKSL